MLNRIKNRNWKATEKEYDFFEGIYKKWKNIET